MALFGRIFAVLDLPVDITERRDARALAPVRGDVRFVGVSFRYDRDDAWTLLDIDLHVPPGTTTALVGETGAGKTTLAYLVAQLYDVRDLRLAALSEAVGLVSQETYLFHESIGDNLRFAAPDATDEQVEAAARAARIHHLIAGLPEGYDTVVGARGYSVLRRRAPAAGDHADAAARPADSRARRGHRCARQRDRTRRASGTRRALPRAHGTHDELLARGGRYAMLAGQIVQ